MTEALLTAVLDANILASGSVASAGTIARLIELWLAGRFTVFLSAHIMREVERALAKPYFAARLNSQATSDYLALVRSVAVFTELSARVHGVASHAADDLVLATAVSSRAEYLVTGDTKLLELGSFRGVSIVGARAFLELLDGQSDVERG